MGETEEAAWVAPIEMKSGRWSPERVERQLQAGADAAGQWLPAESLFRFCPVLAYRTKKPFSKKRRRSLRESLVELRGQIRPLVPIECGRPLREALAQAEE